MISLREDTLGDTDVKWFGAKGNGTADDQEAINRALAAAASNGGGVVLFPPGTYKVGKKLIITSSKIHLLGDGNATIKVNRTAPDPVIDTGLVEAIGASASQRLEDITIENLTFEGNPLSANSARYAVYLEKVSNARIISCKVKGTFAIVVDGKLSGGAFRLYYNTSGCVVASNHIELPVDPFDLTYDSIVGVYCSSDTVNKYGGITTDVNFIDATNLSENHLIIGNVIVPDPTFANPPPWGGGTHPISLFGAQRCRVVGNYINGGSHRAIILSPVAHENVIEGNYCENFQSTGIHLALGSSRNTIVGNRCKTTSLASGVEGNVIKGYFGCSDNSVVGNYCEGSDNAGIRFAIKSNNNTIEGNHIKACGVGIEIESYITATTPPLPPGGNNSDYPFDYGTLPVTLNPVTIEGNTVKNNTIYADSMRVGVRVAQRSKTDGTAFLLQKCTIEGNTVIGNAPASPGTLDDYVLIEHTSGKLTNLIASNNNLLGSPTNKWVLPKALTHFAQFDNGRGVDGWDESPVTWTWISSTSFRMPGDWTGYVSVGDKIRFKQPGTGYKYGYVIGVSFVVNTAVTVVLPKNVVIANDTITDAYFSKAVSPNGHPIWFEYIPSFTGFSTDPVVTAIFMIQGRECIVAHQTSTSGQSNANIFKTTAPVNCDPGGVPFYAPIDGVDGGVNLLSPGKAVIGSSSNEIVFYKDYGPLSNTWTTSGLKRANFSLVYRI